MIYYKTINLLLLVCISFDAIIGEDTELSNTEIEEKICRRSTTALLYATLVPDSSVCTQPEGHGLVDEGCLERRITFETKHFTKPGQFHALIERKPNTSTNCAVGLSVDPAAAYAISGRYIYHSGTKVFRKLTDFAIDSPDALLIDYIQPLKHAATEQRGSVSIDRCKQACQDDPACLFFTATNVKNHAGFIEGYRCGLYRFKTLINSVLTAVEGVNSFVKFNEIHCSLPRVFGSPETQHEIEAWFYNSLSSKCEAFQWKGGAGSEIGLNHFVSEYECNECCGGYDAKINIASSAEIIDNGSIKLINSVTHTIDPSNLGPDPQFSLGLLCHEDCKRIGCDLWTLSTPESSTRLTCSWYKVTDPLKIQYRKNLDVGTVQQDLNFVAILFRNNENICDQSPPINFEGFIEHDNSWWYRRLIDNTCRPTTISATNANQPTGPTLVLNANHFETLNDCLRFCGNFKSRVRIASRQVSISPNEEFEIFQLEMLPSSILSKEEALELCSSLCSQNPKCDALVVVNVASLNQRQCGLVSIFSIQMFHLRVETNPGITVQFGSRYKPDYCAVPINRGTVGNPEQRFAYNIRSGECESFQWLLGEGTTLNFNIFETVKECKQFCGGFFDDLQLFKNVVPLTRTRAFAKINLDNFYSPASLQIAQCHQFCNQENNNLKSAYRCDYWHLELQFPNVSDSTYAEIAKCSLYSFFSQVHSFTDHVIETAAYQDNVVNYIGVKFAAEYCSLPVSKSYSREFDQRWHYSPDLGTCTSFHFGSGVGTLLNFNHFESLASCERFCHIQQTALVAVDPCEDVLRSDVQPYQFQRWWNIFQKCHNMKNVS